MSRFVNRLIERQAATSQVVTPRLRSKFEPEAIPSQTWAMEGVVKAGGEPEAAPGGVRENIQSLPTPVGAQPADRAKEEAGRAMRMEERPVKASGQSADAPAMSAVPDNKEAGRQQQQEEKKTSAPFQQAAKQEAAVVKPTPEAATGEAVRKQDVGHEKHEAHETMPEKRSITAEEGLPRKRITAYDTQSATYVNKETRPREEGWQGRGLLGEVAAGGRKGADPSIGRMTPEPAPVIRVSIGRIEVHAIHPPPVQPMRTQAAAKPKMTLEDFLKKRNEP